jgi:hypothetical protein
MAGGVAVTIGGETLSDTHSRVARIRIDRGRQDELDRTGTGTCVVSLNYVDGSITNFVGADASVAITSPFGGDHLQFVGTVDDVSYDLSPSQVVTRVDVTIVDALDFFAGIELTPGLNGVVPLPAGVQEGNIFYDDELVGPIGADPTEGRIGRLIAESGYGGSVDLFSGNVQVRETIYSPRTSLLSAIMDAADAEFPGVSNFYCKRDGEPTFHGRLARFNPADAQYNISTYTAGDGAACIGDSSRARIHRCTLGSSRQRIINAALATPQGIADDDIEGQVVTDAASIATYGLRSWSAENLLTWFDELNGPFGGTDQEEANAAVLQFAQYYVDNYASPQIRVEGLTFASRAPSWRNSAATWDVICLADISDIITLSVTNPGISISDVDYFVEGVHMEISPLEGTYPLVKKTLDLSPRAYFSTGF